MKKIAIALTVAVLTSFVFVVQAASKENTWYAGGKFGWSQYHDTGFYHKNFYNLGDRNNPVYDNQFGAGTFLGYQANPYLGFEFGYDWLGHITYKGNMSNNNSVFKAQGVYLATKLSYPLKNEMKIYTRFGGMIWRADFKATDEKDNFSHSSNHDTGVSPLAAVGLEYTWAKNWSMRLDYQWVNNIGDAVTVATRPDNSTLSLGLVYHFGQDEAVVTTGPTLPTKYLALKTDVLFDFDKSTLEPSGQQALNQLYSQLSLADQKNSSILIFSYTDRIGTERYNQKLSWERAQSVVRYLVAKGIPSHRIVARSMGKSKSITGNACNNVKDSSALISCLAQDRRVEIEIKKNIKK